VPLEHERIETGMGTDKRCCKAAIARSHHYDIDVFPFHGNPLITEAEIASFLTQS
jgi:hypothetical protein